MAFPPLLDRLIINLDCRGSTAASPILPAIDEARQAVRLRPGQITLLISFGAGLTCGSALIRW